MDRRAAQQQSESASKLAVATDSLVKATKGLGQASRVPSGVCDVAEDRPMIAAIYARKSTDRFEPVLSA